MAQFVESTKDAWLSLVHDIVADNLINTNTHTVVLDMEWAGGNIQKGNAACSGTDKAAYLFDYCRIVSNEDDSFTYVSTKGLENPIAHIYSMESFHTYEATLDFNNPQKCEEILKTMAEYVEDASPIAKYFDKPTNVGEGIYLWCEYNGAMLRLKAKGTKHGGKPKQPRVQDMISDEELASYVVLTSQVTPVWRITQAITETNATEMKHLGQVIKWVITDVAKEETPALLEAGIELKNLSRYISAEVKRYYFDFLKDY